MGDDKYAVMASGRDCRKQVWIGNTGRYDVLKKVSGARLGYEFP
jgi:hypothetical protein